MQIKKKSWTRLNKFIETFQTFDLLMVATRHAPAIISSVKVLFCFIIYFFLFLFRGRQKLRYLFERRMHGKKHATHDFLWSSASFRFNSDSWAASFLSGPTPTLLVVLP